MDPLAGYRARKPAPGQTTRDALASRDDQPNPMFTLLATFLFFAFARYFAPRIFHGKLISRKAPETSPLNPRYMNSQGKMATPHEPLSTIGSVKMNGKHHGKPDEGRKAMEPSRRDNRAQPWKAHWPPKEGTVVDPAYGFKKGEVIKI